MKPRLKTILMLTLTLIFLLALAACQQPTQAPATQTPPTQAASATSAAPQATAPPSATATVSDSGYPAQTATAPQPGDGYPPPGAADPGTGQGANADYPPPSSGVPAAPNLSIVTATLQEQVMDDQMAGYMRLLVVINTSEAAPGMVSRTDDLVNEGINLYTLAGSMPVLEIGDTFTAEVEFRGDENGGRFFATRIEKQ